MPSHHIISYNPAIDSMSALQDEEAHLVVTSPPYPMIEMWDEIFSEQNPDIGNALSKEKGRDAFELMHQNLDSIWNECYRVLKPGGILCINIGDATRKIGSDFQLYSSHSRILQYCISLGFQNLPNILWRKQTNAPNKFMGSGMLPPGAYVTLEHEYILILRKGGKRTFNSPIEKELRRESAYFWEERNIWFSDIWTDLKGTSQQLNHADLRERSGAFPFELAYRLINMYSIKQDTVLDPFLGTGTTTLAAMIAERNSYGFEIDPYFQSIITERVEGVIPFGNAVIHQRIRNHLQFVQQRVESGKSLKNINNHYGFPCISKQETEILLKEIESVDQKAPGQLNITYNSTPQEEFCQSSSENIHVPPEASLNQEKNTQVSFFE